MKPILFVRCDAVDTLGVAPDAMLTSGAEIEVWDSVDPDTSRPDLTDMGGVVLLGSTYNVEHAEEQPFIKEVRELTLEAIDREIPFLGICFGAQVLAWSLDAEIKKAPVARGRFRAAPARSRRRGPQLLSCPTTTRG